MVVGGAMVVVVVGVTIEVVVVVVGVTVEVVVVVVVVGVTVEVVVVTVEVVVVGVTVEVVVVVVGVGIGGGFRLTALVPFFVASNPAKKVNSVPPYNCACSLVMQ